MCIVHCATTSKWKILKEPTNHFISKTIPFLVIIQYHHGNTKLNLIWFVDENNEINEPLAGNITAQTAYQILLFCLLVVLTTAGLTTHLPLRGSDESLLFGGGDRLACSFHIDYLLLSGVKESPTYSVRWGCTVNPGVSLPGHCECGPSVTFHCRWQILAICAQWRHPAKSSLTNIPVRISGVRTQ